MHKSSEKSEQGINQTTNIEPNTEFVKKLQEFSETSLKQCMQCGNCSAICDLSPKENPFPRKEMIWASWGLKDKLIGNVDVWLCHQCGECSTYCPRDVNPGDVLSGIRYLSYQHYAKPKFLGKLLSKPIFLPIAILIPLIFILLIIYFAGTLQIPKGEVNYSAFLPHAYLNSVASFLFLLVFSGIIFSVKSFWKDLIRNTPPNKQTISIFRSVIETFKEIVFHKKFKKCSVNKHRYFSHQLVFWGFITLFIVTFFAIIFVLLEKYPLNFWNPVKIIGNLASFALLIGISAMFIKRNFNKDKKEFSSFYDKIFLISILFLTLSGIGLEIGRFLNWTFSYYIYIFHLLLVWMIMIYLPYTKFAHIIYRTVALIYAKHIGRD